MAQMILFVYAGVMGLVGLEAFVVKHSVFSLAGGLVAAILAILAAQVVKNKPKLGIGLGIAFVLLMSGRFVVTLMKGTGVFWPAGFIVGLSLLTVVLLVPALLSAPKAP